MNKSIQQRNSTNRGFLVIVLLCLILTTFPLAQAWIGIGFFIPRAVMLMAVVFFTPRVLKQTDFLLLVLYFLYIFVVRTNSDLVGIAANYFELAVPIVIAHYLIDIKDYKTVKYLSIFVIVVTTATMILTIMANFSYPNIVRQMVLISANNETEYAIQFRRMGVCDYSFALIVMCMAPVYIYLSNVVAQKPAKLFYIFLLFLTLYFVYISGVTTCLIILLIIVVLSVLMRDQKDSKLLLPYALLVSVLAITFGFTLVEFAEPLLTGTPFESHFDGLKEFFGKGIASNEAYDFEGRTNLYKRSLEGFMDSPLFGGEKNGGHNFFLDRFALYGVMGMIPFISMMYIRFRDAYYFISPNARVTYLICILGFFALGFLKNMSGIDYWTYMFVYIPCILKYTDTLNSKKHRVALNERCHYSTEGQ